MWRLFFAWALLAGPAAAQGQQLRRPLGETADSFARRNKPALAATLTGRVLETTAWDGRTRVIIAFYAAKHVERVDGQLQPEPCVEGYIFVPTLAAGYRRLFLDRYEQEGADASIASVFFANADHDPARELVVLCQWPQRHYQVAGTLYQARFYDNPAAAATRLAPLTALDKLLTSEFDGTNEEGKHTAKYQSAAAIRQKLKQLGY